MFGYALNHDAVERTVIVKAMEKQNIRRLIYLTSLGMATAGAGWGFIIGYSLFHLSFISISKTRRERNKLKKAVASNGLTFDPVS